MRSLRRGLVTNNRQVGPRELPPERLPGVTGLASYPLVNFSGAGRRRVFRAHGYNKAWRLPLLEPSRLPPGKKVFVLP